MPRLRRLDDPGCRGSVTDKLILVVPVALLVYFVVWTSGGPRRLLRLVDVYVRDIAAAVYAWLAHLL